MEYIHPFGYIHLFFDRICTGKKASGIKLVILNCFKVVGTHNWVVGGNKFLMWPSYDNTLAVLFVWGVWYSYSVFCLIRNSWIGERVVFFFTSDGYLTPSENWENLNAIDSKYLREYFVKRNLFHEYNRYSLSFDSSRFKTSLNVINIEK